MNWKDIEPKAIELRKSLLSLLTDIRNGSSPKNLPDPSPSLALSLDLLSNPTYDIVICGEVKKGKSTFINAIIGRKLLPTGVKETTSQVFRITNSLEESYFLVFTDGTKQAIDSTELARYGSQVDADLMGEPAFKNKQLDYIQVNIPVEFLPLGVSIVDTPGLGALYKSHEEITNRYVKNAAAVVFLFDPSQPMVVQEKNFLEKVFTVTPYVMFVMTKIDCYDEANWVPQAARIETLLKESFEKNCYTRPKVFPVASTTLFDAATESDQDIKAEYLDISRFPEAKAELQKIMYITIGLSRTYFAFNEAGKQTSRVLASIEEQLKMITATSKEEQDNIKAKKQQIRQAFEHTWGPTSQKRKDAIQQIQTIIGSVPNKAGQITSSTGAIYKKYTSIIEEISSKESLESLAKTISRDLIHDVGMEWENIAKSTQNEVFQTLRELKTEMESVAISSDFNEVNSISLTGLSSNEKFQSFKSKYFDATLVGSLGSIVLSIAGITVAPIALLAGIVIYGFLGGRSEAEKREMEKNKANLKAGFINMMNEINAQLFHVPLEGGHKSMVQGFTTDLNSAVDKAISAIYEAQKTQLEGDQKLLDEQAKLSSEQRQKELILVNEQRKSWIEIHNKVSEQEKTIKQIQKELV